MKHKQNLNKLTSMKKVLMLTLVITIIIKISFYALEKSSDLRFLCLGINQRMGSYFLYLLILIHFIAIAFLFARKFWIKTVFTIAGIVVMLCSSIWFLFGSSDPSYFYFNSPDNSTTLVVEENSWLLAGWSNFYIKKSILLVKPIENKILTDDGYRPFTNRDYEVSWIDNRTVELSYGFGESNIVKKEIIKLR